MQKHALVVAVSTHFPIGVWVFWAEADDAWAEKSDPIAVTMKRADVIF